MATQGQGDHGGIGNDVMIRKLSEELSILRQTVEKIDRKIDKNNDAVITKLNQVLQRLDMTPVSQERRSVQDVVEPVEKKVHEGNIATSPLLQQQVQKSPVSSLPVQKSHQPQSMEQNELIQERAKDFPKSEENIPFSDVSIGHKGPNFGEVPPGLKPEEPCPSLSVKRQISPTSLKRKAPGADNRHDFFSNCFEIADPEDTQADSAKQPEQGDEQPQFDPNQSRNNQETGRDFRNDHGSLDNRNEDVDDDDDDLDVPLFRVNRRQGLSNYPTFSRREHTVANPGSPSASGDSPPVSKTEPKKEDVIVQSPDTKTEKIQERDTSPPGYDLPADMVEDPDEIPETGVVSEKFLSRLVQREKEAASNSDSTRSPGLDTVICVDTSESMAGEPLENMKAAIKFFLDVLENSATEHALEENVSLVTFGNRNTIVQHLTNDFDLIREAVDGLEARGPSPLKLGLVLATSELESRGGKLKMSHSDVKPRIILFTDGVASDWTTLGGSDPRGSPIQVQQSVIAAVKSISQGVHSITCIPFGKHNQLMLQGIARTGNGKVHPSSDLKHIGRFFRRQNVLNSTMSKYNGQEHVLSRDALLHEIKASNGDFDDADLEETLQLFELKTSLIKPNEGPVQGLQRADSPKLTSMRPSPVHEKEATSSEDEAREDKQQKIKLPAVGSRVRPGPDWTGEDKDEVGTVVSHRKNCIVKVVWDNGGEDKYKYGVDGCFQVRVVNEPRMLGPNEKIQTGVKVKRGPDWRWGNQDGGLGSIGVVTMADDKGVIHVCWAHGGVGNYRYGFGSKHDVEICDGQRVQGKEDKKSDEPMVEHGEAPTSVGIEEEASKPKIPVWQFLQEDIWITYPALVSESIEKTYKSKPKGTQLIQYKGSQYRAVLSTFQVREVSAPHTTMPLQRIELTADQYASLDVEG